MKQMVRFVGIVCLFLCDIQCFAQLSELEREKKMEEVIESIAESDESGIDNSALLEDMTTNGEIGRAHV